MQVGLWEFLTIMMMTFALFLVIVGIFTAYFGSGKSRKIGGGLLGGGIALGLIWMILSTDLILANPIIDVWFMDVIIQSILVIVAAAIGALIALGIFLVAIMKS